MAEELSKMKPQVYKDPRPAEYFDALPRAHARAAARTGSTSSSAWCSRRYLVFVFRARCIDSDKVPAEGPAIVAPNHFSFLDHFFVAVYMRRKVHFMAKSQLFKRPMQFIYTHGGVFPVRRGHRDEEVVRDRARDPRAAATSIVMYAEGGRSRTGELGEAKPGVGRLALETGAPVVPTAIVGTERARNWKRLQFPKVTVQYGDPVRFEQVEEPTREQSQAAADVVFERDQGAPRRAAAERTAARRDRAPPARRAARPRQAAEAGYAYRRIADALNAVPSRAPG